MAENEQEIQNAEQTEQESVGEQNVEQSNTLTQEQFNAALQERLNEVEARSAEQLRQLREAAEAQIRGYQVALSQLQQGRLAEQVEDEDEPMPAGLTPNQQLVWEANKPSRIAMKKMVQNALGQIQQTIAPVVQDAEVKRFFTDKPAIPQQVKDATQKFYDEIMRENRGAASDKAVYAAYIRALAAEKEKEFLNPSSVRTQQVQQSQQKPQPRVVAPNGSADLGSPRRGLTGTVGGSKREQTWQEIQQELLKSGKFPEDPL